jgi:hypothetical protein
MAATEIRFADALGNQLAHLVGPLTSGARTTDVPLDTNGAAHIEPARYPTVVLALRDDVGGTPIAAKVGVTSGTTARATLVTFASWTERGTFLLAFAPNHPEPELSPAIDVVVSSDGLAASAFELRLIEGQLGRLLYLSSFEKHRLRRQVRLLETQRFAATASGESLDRIGAELGVVRFPDTLVWDSTTTTPSTDAPPEDDDRYRGRLRLLRPFVMPTRQRLLEALNGPGDPTSPNAGLLSLLGVGDRFTVRESGAELSVAVSLLAPTNDAHRLSYLQYLQGTWLLHPGNPAELDTRLMENGARVAQKEMYARLTASFDFPNGAALAPELAVALDRLGRALTAAGFTSHIAVSRAQDNAGDSRYELGLGADIAPLQPAVLDQIAGLVSNLHGSTATPPEIAALLAGMTPAPSAQDPIGRWLFGPCGLQTVHPTAAGAWYVSHLPTHGLHSTVDRAQALTVDAHYDAPGDVGPHVLLFQALQQLDVTRASLNVPAWTTLPRSALLTATQSAVVSTALAATSLRSAGLRTPASIAERDATAFAISQVDDAALVTARFEAGFAADLLASKAPAIDQLIQLIATAKRAGVVSTVALQTADNGVLWVLGTVRLPGAFSALNATTPSFHFSAVRLLPQATTTMAAASFDVRFGKARLIPASDVDVCAVVVWSLPYRPGDDFGDAVLPGHIRITVPATTQLSLGAYEFLMNTLAHVHPLGVTVDTDVIRQSHVVPVPNQPAVPMTGRASRTFRPFFQRRHLGGRDYSR